jgi:hypothetical protein
MFKTNFRKPNIKFNENTSSGSRVVPSGRADTHEEANRRFRNFAKAPKTGHGIFIHDKYADIMTLWRDATVTIISLLKFNINKELTGTIYR